MNQKVNNVVPRVFFSLQFRKARKKFKIQDFEQHATYFYWWRKTATDIFIFIYKKKGFLEKNWLLFDIYCDSFVCNY